MSVLRQLKALVLGETWWLPIGVALLLAGGLVAEALAPAAWADAGAFLLLAGVISLLLTAVRRV